MRPVQNAYSISEKWCWANLFAATGAFVDVGVKFHLLFVERTFRGCYDEFEGPLQTEQIF